MVRSENGFSLIEVIAATVIAAIAVIGLAYTFGMGRGFIDEFEIGRDAVAAAKGQLELLATLPANDSRVAIGVQNQSDFVVGGVVIGKLYSVVGWVDDPADGAGAADLNPHDLRLATVSVAFQHGSLPDSVRLTRLLPPL